MSAVTSAGIQLSAWENGDYSRLHMIFMTGDIASEAYDIVSSTSGNITFKNFYNWNKVKVGDFVSIEVKCRNNIVENPTIIGTQDPSGLVFWGFGYGTTVRNGQLINCNVDLGSVANNLGPGGLNGNTQFVSPHNITLDNIKFFGKGDYGTFDSWLYSGIKVHLYTDWFNGSGDWYSSAVSASTSLPPDRMFLYNLSITNCDFKVTDIDHALRLNLVNNRGVINYTSCKNIYDYTHPTFVNDKIIISSATDLSAFGGYPGQTLICKDQYFPREGAIFDWDTSLSAWEIRPGQYISQNYPTSSDSVFVFSEIYCPG